MAHDHSQRSRRRRPCVSLNHLTLNHLSTREENNAENSAATGAGRCRAHRSVCSATPPCGCDRDCGAVPSHGQAPRVSVTFGHRRDALTADDIRGFASMAWSQSPQRHGVVITSPPVGVRRTATSVSVCLSVTEHTYASPRLWNQLPATLQQPRANHSNSNSSLLTPVTSFLGRIIYS